MRHKILSFGFGLLMAFASMPAMAQDQVVKGQVVDENGEPVIGASVTLASDKSKGTVTDFDGNYQLSVPKGGKITITYIGYMPQTIKPGGKTQLQVDSQSLEEVVVVGYGSQKKAHLTGSVSTVEMDDIQDLANGGLGQSLSGMVNGLSVEGGDARPGENARLSIRDVGSLGEVGSTAQQPLFVIDGYIYPNDVKVGNSYQNLGAEAFNNLDPSEVESISVLKDASAAVYGARAANGVILVTTKKGKLGKPSISYSGSVGITNQVSRPSMLSAYDYGRLYNAITAADPTNTSLNHTTALFQADELAAMKNLDYDLLDKYWSTGYTTRHAVNVSGATDRVSYFGGITYFKQDGNLGKLDYDRWNYRAGIDVKITDNLKANLTVSGDYGKKNKPMLKVGGTNDEKDYNLMLTRPRYMPEMVGDNYISSYGPSNGQRVANQDYSFELLQNLGDYTKNMTSNTSINASIDYDFGWSKILKGLKMRFSYSKSINTDKNNQFGSSFTIYQMTRRYGSGAHMYTPTSGDDPEFEYLSSANFNGHTQNNGDILSRQMIRTDNYQMNFTINYARDFGRHHVSALFSIERSETESERTYASKTMPYEFTTGQDNSVKDGSQEDAQFTRSESGTLSYIGRVNYAYADRYLFEFLLRSDASTKFHPDNYWGTFPAISAGWVISEEPWFQNTQGLKWIDFLKIRASWGLTGRDNATPWQWTQHYKQDANRGVVFGENSNSGSRITINSATQDVNTDIHWDKSYKTNLGLDFQFLNKRLAVNMDWYYEKNREMLMKITGEIPSPVGATKTYNNFGEMNSWGWEIGITWRDKIGKDFSYRIGLNTGYHDNEVLNMDFTSNPNELYRSIQHGSRTDIGLWGMQCIGMFRSFQDIEEYFEKYNITSYMGMSKDKVRPGMLIYKDVRGSYNQETGTYDGPDGIVDKDLDQVCLSNRTNPYGFTINAHAEWKGISLTTQLGASWGGYTTLPSAAISVPSTSNIEFYNMPSFWNPDNMYSYQDVYDGSGNIVVNKNIDAFYPNLAYQSVNAVTSSFWRISAASIRLSRLTLAYTFPNAWFKSIGVKNVRLNITGQNLINFYNPYPEKFTSPMAGTFGNYPTLRRWDIGVNLSF